MGRGGKGLSVYTGFMYCEFNISIDIFIYIYIYIFVYIYIYIYIYLICSETILTISNTVIRSYTLRLINLMQISVLV